MSNAMNNYATGISTAIQAEQDLLGALISGNATLNDLPIFCADWFADPVHTRIYEAIEAQAANEAPIDIASLGSILGPYSEMAGGLEPGCALEEVGGPGYLVDLATRPTSPIGAAAYAIYTAWLWRQVLAGDPQ